MFREKLEGSTSLGMAAACQTDRLVFVTMRIRPMIYRGRNEQDSAPRMTGDNPGFSSWPV